MSNVIKTIGSGGTFASVQAWADDINTNANGFYISGDIAIGQVLNDLSTASGSHVSFAAANGTNPICKAILEPSSGNANNGIVAGGIVLTQTNGDNYGIYLAAAVDYHVEIRDLEIYRNQSSGGTNDFSLIHNACTNSIELIVKRCIVHSNQGYFGWGYNTCSAVPGLRHRKSNNRIWDWNCRCGDDSQLLCV